MASLKEQSVYNGGMVVLKVKGVQIGRAKSITARRSYGTEGVYEIDSIMPQEHVYNKYEGSVSLSKFLIRKADFVANGITWLGEDILKGGVLDIEVIDKTTNKTLRCYHGCSVQDYSENFQANAISGEDANFVYLYCTDGDGRGNYITDWSQYQYVENGSPANASIADI